MARRSLGLTTSRASSSHFLCFLVLGLQYMALKYLTKLFSNESFVEVFCNGTGDDKVDEEDDRFGPLGADDINEGGQNLDEDPRFFWDGA